MLTYVIHLVLIVLFEGYGDHRDHIVLTHSSPPRRSSDLFGASDAASITRIWSGGTMAKVATPHRKIVTAAARGEYIVIANSRSIAASPASETISVRSIERSAKTPPSQLPAVRPRP